MGAKKPGNNSKWIYHQIHPKYGANFPLPNKYCDYQRWIYPCLISLLLHLLLASTLAPAPPGTPVMTIKGRLSGKLTKPHLPEVAETKPSTTSASKPFTPKRQRKPNASAKQQGIAQATRQQVVGTEYGNIDSNENTTSADIDTHTYRLQISLAARHLWQKSTPSTTSGISGRSVVKVSKPAGALIPGVSLHRSSGNDALDNSALKNIASAAKRIQTPGKLLLRNVSLLITVDFNNSQEAD